MVKIIGPKGYTREEVADRSRKNGGVRIDSVRQAEVTHRLQVSRGDADLAKEKSRDKAHKLGLVSPLPRDKDGKTSYMPDVVGPDTTGELLARMTDGCRMRSTSDKIARQLRLDRGELYAYNPESLATAVDPEWKSGQPVVAKSRPSSPYKRAGNRIKSNAVIIVRKG